MAPAPTSAAASPTPGRAPTDHRYPATAPARATAVPGLRGFLSARPLLHDPLPFLETITERYGPIVRLRLAHNRIFIVVHPDGIKHVLQDNHRNYRKSVDYKILARLLGQGLVTSEGALWLRQRRLMQPMFHRQKIAALGTMMAECVRAMLERWAPRAARREAFDVAPEMMKLTLAIVGRALLTTDLTGQADVISRHLTVANERFGQIDLGMFVPWLPTRTNLQFRRAVRTLRQIVSELIAARRREGRDHGDLLSMLLAVRDEDTGDGMDDVQLRDEVLTLIMAGHETTATALCWTWYLLAANPAAAGKLHDELDAVLAGRPPTMADLAQLPYTAMVIDEALRLYPPVWAVGRETLADDEIMGYRIPRRSNVIMCQWLTHRHPDFWENPTRFEPERFAPERGGDRPRYAYFPFGGGPRLCIGNTFALKEAQMVLATVAQRYHLRLVPGHPIALQPLVTLRPRYGVRVVLEPRGR